MCPEPRILGLELKLEAKSLAGYQEMERWQCQLEVVFYVNTGLAMI